MLNIVANIIINPETSHVLLLNRKKDPYKNWWAFPGGKIEQGEKITDALERETFEETKIKTSSPQLIAILNEKLYGKNNQLKNHFIIFYFTTQTIMKLFDKNTSEGILQWFLIETPPQNMVPSDKEILHLLNRTRSGSIAYIEGAIIEQETNQNKVLKLTEWEIIHP